MSDLSGNNTQLLLHVAKYLDEKKPIVSLVWKPLHVFNLFLTKKKILKNIMANKEMVLSVKYTLLRHEF